MRTRILLLLALLALLAWGYFAGIFEQVSDPVRLRALLTESGAWGPILFVGLFAVLEGLGAPGFLFILTATRVWPFWQALALMLLGAVGAAVVGFLVARHLGRDLLEEYLPARARRYDEQLAERGFQAVVVVRLLFFIAPWTHWMLGLSRVRFLPFLIATTIGLLPGMLLATYAGGHGLDWLMRQEIEVIAGTAMFVVALIGGIIWWRRRQRVPELASGERKLLGG
jgi:uncharacterized membrane protein YdjX (TVP38/TMEM64 family)